MEVIALLEDKLMVTRFLEKIAEDPSESGWQV